MKFINRLKLLVKINPWKTIYFNFRYFKLKEMLKFPVFIYWHTVLYRMNGKIIIESPIKTGMLHIGNRGLEILDRKYDRTIWSCSGTLVVKGGVNHLGCGCKICIDEGGISTFGKNIMVTGNSEIVCSKDIMFGSNCLLSWDILVMDNDFHDIIDNKGQIINAPKPISIGNHVWIGCRNTILKGTRIADNTVVAAGSVIARCVKETNCIIGGVGKSLEIIKRDVKWEI